MIFDDKFMNPLFDLLEQCRGRVQMEIHHPERDLMEHSLQVLKWAFRESIDTDLILAAMLHDVGKIVNIKGHDKEGVEMLTGLVSVKTLWLIENHMRIWYLILGEMKKLKKVQELSEHPWLPELIMLARWDKMGRNPNVKIKYDRQDIIDRVNKCVEKRFEIKFGEMGIEMETYGKITIIVKANEFDIKENESKLFNEFSVIADDVDMFLTGRSKYFQFEVEED